MRTVIKNFILMIVISLNFYTAFAKDNLVTDLSESTVEISSTFSGADILLFGAYDGQKNDDIIVVVSGQKGEVKVEKKESGFIFLKWDHLGPVFAIFRHFGMSHFNLKNKKMAIKWPRWAQIEKISTLYFLKL